MARSIDGSTRKWWSRWSTSSMPTPHSTPGSTASSADGCASAAHCEGQSKPRSDVTCTPLIIVRPASRQYSPMKAR